jgi:class 3 adenylate cyclase/tetratricopeptide (TPR) repeat protein
MFCDLVGSTALFAGIDPEEMSELVRSYTSCCADYIEAAGGFVAQFQGDGVLGYFGYTQVSESDAERSVRAALELVQAVPKLPHPRSGPLQVRIGISTGLTVVGDPWGEGTRLEQGAVGETLHLAARLQALASPNQVVIAEGTRRLIGSLFICRNLGRVALKGFAEPLRAWRVLGARPVINLFRLRRDPLLTRMVGREAEIENLLHLWSRVIAGRGKVVNVIGEAGIGKSRLINEFRRRMVGARHIWLEGGGTQFFKNTPFYAIAQLIKRALDPAGRASPGEFRGRLESVLEEVGTNASDALPLIMEMLGPPISEAPKTGSGAPAERRTRLVSTLEDWLAKTAQRVPLVLVLEDLHWLDPSSLELLGLIVDKIKNLPVLMLQSMRPGFSMPWPVAPHSSDLPLRRLSDDELREIITCIGSDSDLMTSNDIAQVVGRAEGVPLFGIELTRLVGERSARGADRDIPATLSDLLTARLDQLGPAKSLTQVAAVIGDEIPLRLLEAVAEVPARRIRSLLATVRKRGVLREEGRYPNIEYAFTHSMLRDAAYDALLKRERTQLHRRAATVITDRFGAVAASRPELLAYHWSKAGELKRAVDAWQRAGDFAVARWAFKEAAQGYQNAISILTDLPCSPERDAAELTLQSLLADALRLTHGYSAPQTKEVMARARALADKSGDRSQRALQLRGAWVAASSSGDYAAGTKLADEFYRLALADGGIDILAHAQMIQMTSRYRVGDLIGAEDHFERGGEFFQVPNFQRQPGRIAQTYGNAARIAWILGDDVAAQRRIDHALTIARQNGNPYDLAYAQYMAAIHAVLVDELKLAIDLAKSSNDLSIEYGFAQFATISRIALGRAQAGLGLPRDGVKLIHEGLAGMADTSARVAVTLYLTWLAEAHALAGSLDEALVVVEDALRTNPQELFFRPETLRLRGEIQMRRGSLGEAERDFLEALALSRRIGAKRFGDRATRGLQRLLRHRGGIIGSMLTERGYLGDIVHSPAPSFWSPTGGADPQGMKA